MKQPPIKTKELSGSTVQIADGQNWEIASITAYGETPQGGTTEVPVALTGVDSVQVCGNNLFVNKATEGTTNNGVTFTLNSDKSITVNGTNTSSSRSAVYHTSGGIINTDIAPGTYIISGGSAPVVVEVVIYKANGETEYFSSSLSSTVFNIEDGDILKQSYVLVRAGQTADNVKVYPMLNVGSTALPYEPYNGNITQLPIPRELHRIGEAADKCITRVKSVYDKRIVLDGSESWTLGSAGTTYWTLVDDIASGNHIASSYLNAYENDALFGPKVGIAANSNDKTIRVYLPGNANPSTYFASNPLIVYYQSTAYDGTNGLDVCLTEYMTGFVELDGTEGIEYQSAYNRFAYTLPSTAVNDSGFCSHYKKLMTSAPGEDKYIVIRPEAVYFYDSQYTNADAFNAYLAAQKAAGTPVQVAYQLATPEVYATDPVDFDNTAGPLTIMTGGELEVTLTHRMLTPYTTWAIRYDSEGEYTGDFFNVEDYDRIKQNIEYLREYAYFLYGGFTMRGMVAVTVESYGYASTIDALDANLEAIAANTFRPPDMLPVKQWRGNQPPPGADDWNRIENTCLLLFEQFERQSACLPKLAFELKGSAF